MRHTLGLALSPQKAHPPKLSNKRMLSSTKSLKDPQVIEMMNKAGQEPVAMTPEEFADIS
jgi:tripartite-type tricarboxylate transporter receptor subunit TctC